MLPPPIGSACGSLSAEGTDGTEILYFDGIAAQLERRGADAAAALAKARALFGMVEPTWVLPTAFPEAPARMQDIDNRLRAMAL